MAHRVQSVNADGSISVGSYESQVVASMSEVSKLEGSYYIMQRKPNPILLKFSADYIQIAQTTAYPLFLGADASQTPQFAGCGAFYVGEPVSILLDDGSRVIASTPPGGGEQRIQLFYK